MEALELIRLGRELTKLGEEAMRLGNTNELPNGPRLVLRDVAVHPGSSVKEIVERTGLRQSYVSESLYTLRQQALVVLREDPRDGRRTRVTVAAGKGAAVSRRNVASVDGVITAAVGQQAVPEVLAALDMLADRLRATSAEAKARPGAGAGAGAEAKADAGPGPGPSAQP